MKAWHVQEIAGETSFARQATRHRTQSYSDLFSKHPATVRPGCFLQAEARRRRILVMLATEICYLATRVDELACDVSGHKTLSSYRNTTTCND